MGNVSKVSVRGFPPPRDIGLPQKFSSWRMNQEDAINEFLDCDHDYLAQCMPTGCHAKGTGILMFDGSVSAVEHVKVDDFVMGPDGTPRRVLALHHGYQAMVRIYPKRGAEPFVVNIDHSLYLVPTTNRTYDAPCTLTVRDYLRRSDYFKHIHKLVFSPGVPFWKRRLSIDPYFLGIWLGDGSISGGVNVTTQKPALERVIREQADLWGLRIRESYHNNTCTYYMPKRGKWNRWIPNPLREELLRSGVYTPDGFKCVPWAYKTADRSQRLELLAGLIDTDGHVQANGFQFSSKSAYMAKDVQFICRSLGLRATMHEKVVEKRTYYVVGISGDTDIVPARAKKAGPRGQKKRSRVTGFDMRFLPTGSFYGFELDGDRLYLTEDFIVHHNSGKSLTYVSDAVLSGMSTVILTSTKALQTQLLGDFAEIGMVEIKGKNAYRCVEDRYGRGCDYGDCNFGLMCDRQKSGCHYYDALASARTGKLVVTNYAYWLTMNRFAEGLKHPQLLVMDEAHHAETHLAHTFSFHIRPKEIDSLLQMKIPTSLSHLSPWADKAWATADTLYEHEKFEFQQRATGDKDLLRKIKGLRDKLEILRKHVGDADWLVELQDGIKFCPIWPKQYAKSTLFKNTGKVLMTSATVRPKTVEMLGLTPRVGRGDQMSKAEVLMAQVDTDISGPKTGFDCLFSDYPSIFDPERRLVIHIPTVRVNHRTTKEEYAIWMKRIDQIITPRLHQKGIIHTVSYDRRNYVMEHSEYAEHMITHTTDSVVAAVAKFKKADPPAILVSPSVTTGFDFPFDQTRWQILGKLPFPDTRDRLTKARMERDPEYSAYLAMQSLVQASGRGTRAPNDSCVSFLIDDSAFWFMKRFARFAPRWFMDGYRTSDLIPQVREE